MFFYVANSSTKQNVYKDQPGLTAWSNPIVLDSGGNLPGGFQVWFTASVVYDVVYAPSNDTDPPTSPYVTLQDLSGTNDVATQTGVQWISGPAPTFVGTTRLAVAGDQTATLSTGRRIQTTNTGGTIYSTITSSIFSTSTALGVRNDSGVLDSGLSALSYGLLSALNPSIPIISDFYPARNASSDATKLFRVEVNPIPSSTTVVETLPIYSFRPATQNRGAQVSSQSTTNVSTATGDLIEITNTNAINQFTMFDGQFATLYFTTTTPLVYSTTLPIPGNANITTVAGDMMTLRGTSTAAVRVQGYQPQNINPALPGMIFIASTQAVSTVNVDFTSGINSTYAAYVIYVSNVRPTVDTAGLRMQMFYNATTVASGGADYAWTIQSFAATSSANGQQASLADSSIGLIGNMGTSLGENANGVITLYSPSNTQVFKHVMMDGAQLDATPNFHRFISGGYWGSTSAFVGVRLFMSSGSTAIGQFSLYAIRTP